MEMAKVNGRVISDRDVKMALGNLNDGQRETVLKDPNSRRQVLNGLIDQELLSQEGEKERLDRTPSTRRRSQLSTSSSWPTACCRRRGLQTERRRG